MSPKHPTDRQLEILAAWWYSKGSNVQAAFVLGRHPQTIKNTLFYLRRVHGASSNVELVQTFMEEVGARRHQFIKRAA